MCLICCVLRCLSLSHIQAFKVPKSVYMSRFLPFQLDMSTGSICPVASSHFPHTSPPAAEAQTASCSLGNVEGGFDGLQRAPSTANVYSFWPHAALFSFRPAGSCCRAVPRGAGAQGHPFPSSFHLGVTSFTYGCDLPHCHPSPACLTALLICNNDIYCWPEGEFSCRRWVGTLMWVNKRQSCLLFALR